MWKCLGGERELSTNQSNNSVVVCLFDWVFYMLISLLLPWFLLGHLWFFLTLCHILLVVFLQVQRSKSVITVPLRLLILYPFWNGWPKLHGACVHYGQWRSDADRFVLCSWHKLNLMFVCFFPHCRKYSLLGLLTATSEICLLSCSV